MIIDFHTHTFPVSIAQRTLQKLSSAENLTPFTQGTNQDLLRSMKEGNVDLSILLPVATSPQQVETINQKAIELNSAFQGRGLLSFGAIHPDTPNYKEVLQGLAENHIPGIKLHPVFQKVFFDDKRYYRIVEEATRLGLIISVHAGKDITWPDVRFSCSEHILPILRDLQPDKLILAHMGGWNDYDAAEEMLSKYPTWLDTSFILPQGDASHFFDTNIVPMQTKQFMRLVELVGAEHVLFGTDSPWTGQKENVAYLKNLPLTAAALDNILGENALRLLKSVKNYTYNEA